MAKRAEKPKKKKKKNYNNNSMNFEKENSTTSLHFCIFFNYKKYG